MGKSGTTSLTTFQNIAVKDISLDIENPRYAEAMVTEGIKKWTDKKLQEFIVDEDISDIYGSIKAFGIQDHVWVVEKANGKYIMVEGSRRLVSVRQLANEKPPKGVNYKIIPAHVYPKNTNEKTLHAQKIILQTGKKKWGAFNESKALYDLINNDNYTLQEAAKMWKKSVSSVEKELENFKIYTEFTKWVKKNKGFVSPRHYSYFQKASLDVREKFFSTKPQREKFYKLIVPDKKTGTARISSVSLKGGLIKTFNKFAADENILQAFLKNRKMGTDDALLKFQGGDIKHEFPWTKKLKEISNGLKNLSSEDLKKIKKDKAVYNMIAKISDSTSKIVEKK
jgi:hypothetical protein